jgi:hypothetical protein
MQLTWVERAVKFPIVAIVGGIVIAAIVGGMSEGVHELWNGLMPRIFRLPVITFWQSVGLLALSWILFGGFGWLGLPGRRSHRRHRLHDAWDRMDPEQRAKFRERLRGACKPTAAPPEGSTA